MITSYNPRVASHAGVRLICYSWIVTLSALPVTAQQSPRMGTPVRATYAGAVAAGTAALLLIDEPVRTFFQTHRGESGDDVARVFRQLGEVDVVYPASLGILGFGVVTTRSEIKRGGAQMFGSLLVASGVTIVGKYLFGRARPNADEGAWSFSPFEGVFNKGLPSGHTALAFAVATTVADFTNDNIVRAAIYAAAGGTAWSRMNDDRHWLSDVWLGAALGVMSSKFVTGRWTVFGIETPDYFAEPDVEPVNFGELALGSGIGLALYHVSKFAVTRGWTARPVTSQARTGEWLVGLQFEF